MAQEDVTALLRKWKDGDPEALDAAAPLIYTELRRQARRFLRREGRDHSWQSAELVHEAYLRLVDQRHANWHDRTHFFAVSAQLMRRILVDHARRRIREKRGGGIDLFPINEAMDAAQQRSHDVIALDDALTSLAKLDPQQCQIVELRYFAGLSIDETAEAMGLSTATVNRYWVTARAWLLRQLGG